MWWIRCFGYIVPPFFAAFALLLTGAIAQQNTQTTPASQSTKSTPSPSAPAVDVKPLPADEKAVKTLKVAAEMLDAKKLGWFTTTVWQRVDSLGLAYESEGKYSGGPDMRVRVELEVVLGKTKGKTTIVSDGTTVWNSALIGSGTPTVSRWDLKRINGVLSAPGTSPQLRQMFYREQFFAGLAPLIQSLEQHMIYTKQEIETWKGHEVYKLTGVAPESAGKAANAWPLYVPRSSRCYFDKTTLWPHRLEWWGPTNAGGEDALLSQMEFRAPKFFTGEAMPTELAQAFKFEPGKGQILDRTQEMTELLTRQRMIAPNQQPGKPVGSPRESHCPLVTAPLHFHRIAQ
ncbi:hypothetical protein BH10PLA2_BH10PLA2_14890 [soil metagenome]